MPKRCIKFHLFLCQLPRSSTLVTWKYGWATSWPRARWPRSRPASPGPPTPGACTRSPWSTRTPRAVPPRRTATGFTGSSPTFPAATSAAGTWSSTTPGPRRRRWEHRLRVWILGQAHWLALGAPALDSWIEITKSRKFVIQGFVWTTKLWSQVPT